MGNLAHALVIYSSAASSQSPAWLWVRWERQGLTWHSTWPTTLVSYPEAVDDRSLKGIKTTNAWSHIILHLVIYLGPGGLGPWRIVDMEASGHGPGSGDPGACWTGNLGDLGPGGLRLWMPGKLGAWGPGGLGTWEHGDLGVWKTGDLGDWGHGNMGPGDLEAYPLQYVECVGTRV